MNAPSDWFESFFSGLAVDFWKVAVPESATLEEVGFLWKHLHLGAGSRVLDVPCGPGRLSLALAASGCAVTGVDISEDCLKGARASADAAGLSITWRLADMRDLPWSGQFDAAFCFGNSFGYLDDDGNEAFLASVARTLGPEALFAIDYGQTAESIFPRLEPRLEAEIGGFQFAEDTRYDIRSGRIENRFTISRDGKTESKLASQRVYTVNEVIRLLARAGFEVVDLFGSPAEAAFELSAQRLLIVARKRETGAASEATRG
jgi:SAM-dependent methyltransferase